MSSQKIKIFLGAYLNSTNAQNLNALALAHHLDKSRFKVFGLSLYSGNLKLEPIKGVSIFRCFNPLRISKYLGYLWGILNCDVAYLPKRELVSWTSFWLRLLHKKSFSTVEGILDEKNLESAIQTRGSYDNVIRSFQMFDRLYSITKFLKTYNQLEHHITTESKPLYLGTNTKTFLNTEKQITKLSNVIYIGRLLERKGVYDVLDAAKAFPELQFHLVGDGQEREAIKKHITQEQLANVKLHGIIDHSVLNELLKTIDLHVLPSRSEGFPKVILETAAAGVPSIVYNDYGASEWISHLENGFVVQSPTEIGNTIQSLLEQPELLQLNSKNAIALAKQFDWNIVIKQWEQEISNLYHS
ncbi:glycosyltransferase family 4 protein [Psychroserpens algicola]|uniref:Glycosyltransferase family 4 protein n=1 Tax=Psychroserpens algicola TaxID=1719034 RepID=A0ABT0H865_9FLAO|nr:glycosyltransferase family 4 protein [Psychroserpens algicola]MCK8480548.1 glycosyltransferase family 4 protein [Psychroserpens algicola]